MSLWVDRNWQVMLLKEINKPFDSKDYLFEAKYDGMRAVLFVSPSEVEIYNRHGLEITKKFPELQNIKTLVQKNVIFDGEIVCLENGVPSFANLQKRAHLKNEMKINYGVVKNPVTFVAFDILYENQDLINYALIKRKKYLEKYPDSDEFIKTHYILEFGTKVYETLKNLNLEGIVAQKIDSVYELTTRSDAWIKIKNWQRESFIIGGYLKNKNNSISLLLGIKENEKLKYVGKVTASNKREIAKKVLKEKTFKKSPFSNYQEKAFYIKNNFQCLVEFICYTSNGSLRQPKLCEYD